MTAASFDLGPHARSVTAASPDAQRWFDLGLNWCFASDYETAAKPKEGGTNGLTDAEAVPAGSHGV